MTGMLPAPGAVAVLVPVALALVVAARRHPRWRRRRTLAGLAGLAALAVASASGLDDRAAQLLSAHMLQHALIQLVAAPLLVAAAPVRLALGTLRSPARRRLARLLHRWHVLTHPAVGLTVFVVALALVHLPAVYDGALRHPLLHAGEHALLLWSAIALWVPIIGADPVPQRTGAIARVAVLIAAMTAMSALGATLTSISRVAYPAYVAPTVALGHDPLRDQALAGGIMWVSGMVAVLPALLVLAWNALWLEERTQRRRERHVALGAAGAVGSKR
jgi:cytochrome c oxidase assembly factor CtaG